MAVFVLVLHVLVSERESWGIVTRSLFSTFSADFMGVAHFLADRRRVDWQDFGEVGVDCVEVLVESVLVVSDIFKHELE